MLPGKPQAASPLEDPNEHGSNRLAIAHHIYSDDTLADAYTAIFGELPDLSDQDRFPANAMPTDDPADPLGLAWSAMDEADADAATAVFINVAKAIGAYEAQLVQGDSPFDDLLEAFIDGDATGGPALSDEAKAGAALFVGDSNCWACHSGPTFTNKEFHNVALPAVDGLDNESPGRHTGIDALLSNPFNSLGEYSDDTSSAEEKLGHLVQSPEQLGTFKTPSLRNLMDTAPYMHGGQIRDLKAVMEHYNEAPASMLSHNEAKPLALRPVQLKQLEAFMATLTAPLQTERKWLLPPVQ